MSDRFVISTSKPMMIHILDLSDGSACRTYKPALVCDCGRYAIQWVPAPTSSLAHLWERWRMEGFVPDGSLTWPL
jgi:hypothetical protein